MKLLVKALSGLGALVVVLALTSASALAKSAHPAKPASMSAIQVNGGVSATGYRLSRDIPAFPSQCNLNEWCLFTGTGFSGTGCGSQGSSVSLSGICRNSDESIADNDSLCGPPPNDKCAMRIYFHPFSIDDGGAHTCLDYGKSISNLNNSAFVFNSGSGEDGFGETVWRNVGAVAVSLGTCSDPIEPGR